MFKNLNNKRLQSGLTLPITIIFSLIGTGILFSYILTIYEKDFQVEFEIAQTKALYNAESGIALAAYTTLFKKDYAPSDSDTVSFVSIDNNMGDYSIGLFEGIDSQTYQPMRGANSTGYAYVKHLFGKKEIRVDRQKVLNLGNTSSLADFLWLTDSELAGGAPWSMEGSSLTRRPNTWGANDELNAGWIGEPICDVGFKTNGTFVTSEFGTPNFDITVSVVEDENGDIHYPDIQTGNEGQIFQGNPPLDTVKTTCLPPPGYEIMKRAIQNSNEHYTFDATDKLNYNAGSGTRDTLIMTDIQFFTEGDTGGFEVKQWWFLKPPYFKTDVNSTLPFMYSILIDNEVDDCEQINGTLDIRTCPNYIEQLENFHSKTINMITGEDSFIPPDYWGIVSSTHGFHHYDFPAIYESGWVSQFEIDNEQPFSSPDQLLSQYVALGGARRIICSNPTAIYVKGGPVRVHGRYKGKYTIVTDEHTEYHRHAWATDMGNAPRDTLWNNIWIIDDLINDDADSNFSLYSAQPDEECNNGSNNNMGLVSGANVYVANTEKNGADNGNNGSTNCGNDNNCDINIHAHIIAFNESFASQYWQNTYGWDLPDPDGPFGPQVGIQDLYSNPPFGDGQGIDIYGSSGNNDERGKINLWGGAVQKYRGYIVRNSPGPYLGPNELTQQTVGGDIGYDGKNYNFDCNLRCSFPPLYPENTTCDESADELPWSVTAYY